MASVALNAFASVDAEKAAERPSAPDKSLDLEEHLRLVVGYFQEAEDQSHSARQRSERCRDYYNNFQYTSAELAELRKRKQAPVYDNFIQRKVDTLCGLERRARSDPRALPRNPDDGDAAEAATDALVFVAQQNKFNSVRSQVFNEILVEGAGGALVSAETAAKGEIRVKVTHIPWDRLWWDPHSRRLDFSDAAYKGIVIWKDRADAEREWPDAIDAIESTMAASESMSHTYEDRPKYTWCDSKRKRIRVVECHYLYQGEWWCAKYTKGGFFEEPERSVYVDKDGAPACPLILRSGFVDRENNRFGHTEGLIPLQDEINKRRSKMLHLLSVRQSYGNKTAVTDTKLAKQELAKPDGHVELNGGAEFGRDFGILPTGDMAQGQFELLQQSLASMNATGANSALQGKDNNAPSGVALQTKIQAGATELEPQVDGLREWTHEVYEAMWMRIRQFWTEEKWIRVTDDERKLKWVGLNKRVTLEDKLATMAPDTRAQAMKDLQLRPDDPQLKQVIEIERDVSGLDVDIEIDDGPDMAALQGAQFEQLVQLAGSPFMQGAIPSELIIKASSLRNKDELLEALEKHQQNAGQPNPAQEAQLAKDAADVKVKESTAALNQAKTEQTLIASHIDGMQALHSALAGHAADVGAPLPSANPAPQMAPTELQ